MISHTEARVGRPRGFDADEALDSAMRIFWERGYEGASLADLTGAMKINRTSMYAAFGNKEQLFQQVLQRYTEGPASYGARALKQATAREVATAFLNGSVRATTSPGDPTGCLGVQGALASGSAAHGALTAWRHQGVVALRERFQRAVAEGDLPSDTDAGSVARHLMTVASGITVQAAHLVAICNKSPMPSYGAGHPPERRRRRASISA